MVNVAILGGSGYTGGELLRLLATHPEAKVTYVASKEHSGKPIHYVHYNLRGVYRGLLFRPVDVDAIINKADAVFLSLPPKASLQYVPKFYEVGLKVIDLSPDFRLKDPRDYVKWYGYEHPYPDLLGKFTYGLPELHREEIRGSVCVASPGCNATASILTLIPLAKKGLLPPDLPIVIDVKVGSSEAGSKPSASSHHPEREGSVRPYSPSGHRHSAEVVQELKYLTSREFKVSVTPHVVSSVRGALSTSYVYGQLPEDELIKAFVECYGKEPFVRIVYKVPPKYPNPKYVVGSNYADVGFSVEKDAGLIKSFAAIDNLVKGGAGQAVQAFNIMHGFDERLGLGMPPLKPG